MSRKRKTRTQARRERAKSSPQALIQRGKSAFERGDLNAAIDTWEEALRKAAMPILAAALAEAYFRRGVTSVPPSLNDLQRAAELAPNDPRLLYHLGRAHHWRGELDEAAAIYRDLLAKDPPYRRAAFPLAQILTIRGHDAAADPAWPQLSPNEQDCLICVKALRDGRPAVALRHAPRHESDALWPGLAGIALGETDSTDLQASLDNPHLPVTARAVTHYYLGVVAGRQGRWPEATAHWQAARGAGLDTHWLRQNLASAYCLQAQELLASAGDGLSEENRWAEAHRLAELGLKLGPENADLIAIRQQAHLQLGYTAALRGQWATALSHWQTVNQGDKIERGLVINMALANEKLENYDQAADLWRQALRRRPRKADAPDALSDEQVAYLWQHVAENYRKAGDYAEATKVYRNAIKWDPDDVHLRLSLVEALMADGRMWAASNMVNEVLAAHPNHVEALAWQAQIYEEDHYGYAARRAWERVLDLDSQHAQARQHLAFLYEEQGDYHLSWDMFGEAIAAYQKGLEYMPNSAGLCASIGLCLVLQEDWEAARQQFEQAFSLEPNSISARQLAIRGWLEVGQWDQAWAVLQQTEALTSPPSTGFYVDLAEFCQELEQPEWAKRLLKHAEERNPHDPRLLFEMAMALTHEGSEPRAIVYLRRALDLDPDLAEAHLWLGNLYFASLGQTRLARRHWRQAESIAQRNGDQAMLYQIRFVKDYFLGKAGFPSPLIPGAPFDNPSVGRSVPFAGFFDDDDYD